MSKRMRPARRDLDACTTPAKRAYPDERRARWGAGHVALHVIAEGLEFTPCYGYVCACRWWHLTTNPGPASDPNVLLKSVPIELQEWAQGSDAGSWRVMDDDDIESMVL